jgi:taurine dioxygenase
VSQSQLTRVEVRPTGAALGADVTGVDLGQPLDDVTFELIRTAWMEHQVLRFRGQELDENALTAFSQRFGLLDRAPIHASNTRDHANPYVLIVSNIVENGQAIGSLGNYEAQWHIDMSYVDVPPQGSALYAVEVPPMGGDTGFTNLYRAYESLPRSLRLAIEGRVCTHDSSRNSAGELRQGFSEVTDPREAPGAVHPLVRIHPVTGRPVLFLGRRRNAYIHGLELEKSETLLDQLWAHATREENGWYQQWRVGDLVMWDNHSTMHRRESFDPATRRLMLRTQIAAKAA